ncbi:MAG: hypothetical protein WA782_16690 [Sulfitobacter sp.]
MTPTPEPPTPEPPTPEPPTPEPPEEVEKKFKGEGKEPGDKSNTPEPPIKTKVPVVVVPPTKMNTYPVHTGSNYCPAGLQPVTISGVISCGKPNQSMTYQQMLKHPQMKRVKKTRRAIRRHSAVPTCLPGLKGCSDR